jgi:O-antigen/teichoic acid export membrane protein
MGRSAASMLAAQVVTAILTLASSVVVARAMGRTGAGTLTVLITTSWIASVLLEFGMSSTAAYGVGQLGVRPAAIMGVFGALSVGVLVVSAAIAFSPLSGLIASALHVGSGSVVAAGVVGGACLMSTNLVRQLLMTARHDTVTPALWPLDRLLLVVALLVLLGRGAGIGILPAVFAASLALSLLAHWLSAGMLIGAPGWVDSQDLKKIVGVSRGAYGSSVLQVMNYRLDVFLVSGFAGAAAVGVYGVAVSITSLLWYLPNAIAFVWLPRVARLGTADATARTASVSRLTFSALLVAAIVLVVVGRPLISLVWGPEFDGAYVALLALLPGVVVFAVPKVVSADLLARGRSDVPAVAAALSLVVTVALDVALIPRIGVLGAALASSAAYLTFALYCVLKYSDMTGLLVRRLFFSKQDLIGWGRR